jgi:hypothetical protein
MRSGGTYNTSNPSDPTRPKRVAVKLYGDIFQQIWEYKLTQANIADGKSNYIYTLQDKNAAQAIFRSKLTSEEGNLAAVQDQISARDYAGDFGFIKTQDLRVAAQVTQAVGTAVVLWAVAAEAAPAFIGTSAEVATTGAATESGTLLGSTGLLSDASITVAGFDVGGAATTVGASGSTGLSALAGLIPSLPTSAELAAAGSALLPYAESEIKKYLTPKSGDTPVATQALIKEQPNPLPLLAALGLIFIL